jgi:hypothetical protein
MDTILIEFEDYLRTIIKNYLIPGSKGTIPGIMGKELQASTFSAEYDTKASARIDDILNNESTGMDKEQLKQTLVEKANEVYGIFTADSES